MNEPCQIDQIYSDFPPENQNLSQKKIPPNVLGEKKTSFQKPSFTCGQCQNSDKCSVCSETLIQGEIVYYCNCEKFYHPNCLVTINPNYANLPCEACSSTFFAGIYKLKNPVSVLNNNYDINSSPFQDQNTTCEKTFISMDTNINKLENYEKKYNLAFQMNPDSLIEMIKYDICNSSNLSEYKDEIGVLNTTNNKGTENKNQLNRIALSPINNIGTPYSGKSKVNTDFFSRTRNEYSKDETPNTKSGFFTNNNVTPDTSINRIRQHLTLGTTSNQKDENSNDQSKFEGQNNSLYSIFERENLSNVSFRKLLFDDIEEESVLSPEDEEDKENMPPLPKENSKYSCFEPVTSENRNPNQFIEINIEGGISHIVSDTSKVVDIPITIDLTLNDSNFSYTKDTLLIFNTKELNVQTIYQIIKAVYSHMIAGDRIFSNVFNTGKWLPKEEIGTMLQSNNFSSFIQQTSTLNFIEIAKLVLYGIDLSFEFYSNIFSIVFINDVDEIPNDADYSEHLKSLVTKLQDSKINLIKQFTINTIILNDNSKEKTKANAKFVSYMYDLSMLCMGYFYSPKDATELMKSIELLFSTLEQLSALNVKLNIKGNKDPSIYIDCMNYPVSKKNHNHYEVYLGSIMRKEKKFLCLNAKVILSNNYVSLNLPIVDVSCEYLIAKGAKILDELDFNSDVNMSTNINNLIRDRTNYYSLSIPIIAQNREVTYSNSVFLRYIASCVPMKIANGVDMIKEGKYDDARNYFIEIKNNFDLLIRNKTNLFRQINFLLENSSMMFSRNRISTEEEGFSNQGKSFALNTLNSSSNIAKISNFVIMIFNDLNFLIETTKKHNMNFICDLYSICESLSYYRSVILSDERFIEDNFN